LTPRPRLDMRVLRTGPTPKRRPRLDSNRQTDLAPDNCRTSAPPL
jgi:hypothetical protein